MLRKYRNPGNQLALAGTVAVLPITTSSGEFRHKYAHHLPQQEV